MLTITFCWETLIIHCFVYSDLTNAYRAAFPNISPLYDTSNFGLWDYLQCLCYNVSLFSYIPLNCIGHFLWYRKSDILIHFWLWEIPEATGQIPIWGEKRWVQQAVSRQVSSTWQVKMPYTVFIIIYSTFLPVLFCFPLGICQISDLQVKNLFVSLSLDLLIQTARLA